MPEVAIDLKKTMENVLASYEAGVESLSSMFEASRLLVDNLPDSLLEDKKEKEKINNRLRDLLAKNGNLRKKDFDNMMDGVLSFQEESGEEVKALTKEYFNEERSAALELRKTLGQFKDALAKGEVNKIKDVQSALKKLFGKQDKRKLEIVSRLKEFKSEQKEIPRQLRELLAKGEDLRIRDFKSMLNKIKALRVERLSLQKKRKEGVANMLQDFRTQRQILAVSTKAIDIDKEKRVKKLR